MENQLLLMKNIEKSFPGVKALEKAYLELNKGEVNVILGENGAGKSTLMKILTGVYTKDQGDIFLEGNLVHINNPKEAEKNGISIIYQEFNLLPHLKVSENIFVTRLPKNKFGLIDEKKLYYDCKNILNKLNLNINPNEIVENLSVAQQQMVEIAKALSVNCKILIMDEPTAALTEKEINDLFKVILDLKKQGVGIIYISHRMEELKHIADRVTIMRDGQYISTLDFKNTSLDEMISLMVGRSLENKFPKRNCKIGEISLEIKNISKKGKYKNISFNLKKGEILGIAGLMGSGRTEIARGIFGADPIDSGEIFLENNLLSIKTPTDAIKNGIAYLTEDRKKDGLLLSLTVEDNIMIANPNSYSNNFKICNFMKSKDICNKFINSMNIKTPSLNQTIRNLSGGNQQKVIIARWLCEDKKVLLIDEPTRGIDVGAKKEVYTLMNDLVSRGISIIMISSELPEILGMSDRVAIMREGEMTGIFDVKDLNQEKIMHYATIKK
ncbi:ribose transport system ATP-binding protein [Cetobacterium ceti]|uniref:Ribose transport system ATP-binding protein n=1 Tax=Cetobacterium ceti TaxID=180163 RepID=A0A1T4MH79_9FUSO|nr:sugar ABC transporter ATP-binding protein [Cetobacterium ceti]SJZ66225.1 ribose transport system ATP-binding protein [Cetobacterium ceti]